MNYHVGQTKYEVAKSGFYGFVTRMRKEKTMKPIEKVPILHIFYP